ncbi:putative Beta-grasp domain-containing protein [Medicago truncatula]|uniref:Putative Beta-grasp domain-containing protein n=1 Tax=Medicago truncatula TaxID=3880 RepID=A0A396H407_MEDTR|nr:putative Beta-grasp domain-containing protein [Medicago truncatula]
MALASLRKLTTITTRQTTLSYLSQSPICRPTSTQKVSDRIVRLSAIDFQGQKHNVIGLSGQTLLKALINTGLIDPDSHRLEDIDACSAHCEINIAQEWLDKLPARSYDEEYVLKHNSRARVLNTHSRLGCQVLLNQDLQGEYCYFRLLLAKQDSKVKNGK